MNPTWTESMSSGEEKSFVSCESLSDNQLVEFAVEGRAEAFGVLHRRYRRRLQRTALRITKNAEDSEDAVQEAFLNAFRHIESFNGRSSFYTWITRIVINTCLMQLRQRRGWSCVPLDEAVREGELSLQETIADPSVDIEGEYGERQRVELLAQAISALTPKLRTFVDAYRRSDCTVVELAELHQISLAAAKSRLVRARVALQATPGLCRERRA